MLVKGNTASIAAMKMTFRMDFSLANRFTSPAGGMGPARRKDRREPHMEVLFPLPSRQTRRLVCDPDFGASAAANLV
jgi:hypothetical protein